MCKVCIIQNDSSLINPQLQRWCRMSGNKGVVTGGESRGMEANPLLPQVYRGDQEAFPALWS